MGEKHVTANKDLNHWRSEIDKVDGELRKLLAKRMECALEVAKAKESNQQENAQEDPIYYRPGREAQMMRGLAGELKTSLGEFPTRAAIQVWRELISASIMAQALGLSVAVADETCQLLAQAHFGAVSKIEVHPSALQVLKEVESGRAIIGIVDDQGLVDISNAPSSVNVVGLLPFVRPSATANRYVLARQAMEPSGDDLHLYRLPDTPEGKATLKTINASDELDEASQKDARFLGGYARPLELS
ncbi:MAG: chorismate mutase [Alphaproteobacteria bacterium]